MSTEIYGNLRVYACGGAGISIASFFDPSVDHREPGHSAIHPVYVDTSFSNLTDALPKERIFLLKGVDGSGKVRKENYEEISKNVKPLLNAYTPMDMNIVVFSAGGG